MERYMEARAWGRIEAFMSERQRRRSAAARRAASKPAGEPMGELVLLPSAVATVQTATPAELAQRLLDNFFSVDDERKAEIEAFSDLVRADYRERFRR
jgi:hypothetical protein